MDWMLDTTDYLRSIVFASCILAVPYYLYSSFRLYKKEGTIRVRGAGGKLFLAFLFFFIVKVEILTPPGVQPYFYDGERGVAVIPNLFWKSEKIDLELRFDAETDTKLWMAKKNGKYYPFFVLPDRF